MNYLAWDEIIIIVEEGIVLWGIPFVLAVKYYLLLPSVCGHVITRRRIQWLRKNSVRLPKKKKTRGRTG